MSAKAEEFICDEEMRECLKFAKEPKDMAVLIVLVDILLKEKTIYKRLIRFWQKNGITPKTMV